MGQLLHFQHRTEYSNLLDKRNVKESSVRLGSLDEFARYYLTGSACLGAGLTRCSLFFPFMTSWDHIGPEPSSRTGAFYVIVSIDVLGCGGICWL